VTARLARELMRLWFLLLCWEAPCASRRRVHREYDESMQRARVTVTVRQEVLATAEEEVAAGRASSISAWVDQAMEEKARHDDLVSVLAEMRAENGPASEEEDAWAREVLGL
jgi:hypothetical protein